MFVSRKFKLLLLIAVVALSCVNNDFHVNEKGLEYKFIEKHDGSALPKVGDVVAIQMRFTDKNNKTLEESAPFRIQLNKPSHEGGSIEDALIMMHKGDSAVFKINALNYYTKTKRVDPPRDFEPDEKLTFYIRLIDITPYDDFVKERNAARVSDQRQEDMLLKDYLERANITIEPTMSGLYLIELRKGNGPAPKPGKKVTVNYMGYFIDGRIFDSSYDRKEPFEFVYGIGQVIQGWDEALGKMKVGGKYKVIIPSYLAYGSVQRGPIPPYSTLIFEMELLDVEK